MGINSVCIPTKIKRHGYAEQVLKLFIDQSIQITNNYITVQASKMEKGLSLKLESEKQFVIKNHILHSKF